MIHPLTLYHPFKAHKSDPLCSVAQVYYSEFHSHLIILINHSWEGDLKRDLNICTEANLHFLGIIVYYLICYDLEKSMNKRLNMNRLNSKKNVRLPLSFSYKNIIKIIIS